VEAEDHRLDPQARAMLERAAGAPEPHRLPVEDARRLYREARIALAPPVPAVDEVRELVLPGPGGELRARYYRPLAAGPQPIAGVVFFHGGGWTLGDLDTHDTACRGIANEGRCAVLSVDYRLAPEHRFPAALEDAVAAVRWTAAQAAELGIDADRLAVAGDSAGGNLAAATALVLRGSGIRLAMQILVYPVTDQSPGMIAQGNVEAYGLTAATMHWFRGHYLGHADQAADWRASPLRALDVSHLPRAYILTAGFDPLLDQGRAYAERLQQAGVPVTYECFEGQIHGFLLMGGAMAAANHAIYRIGQAIRMQIVPKPASL
jgi:acetyl esterase